jgi:hypothetical protein
MMGIVRALRRWWWAILLVLVLIVRAVLPGVVRGQIETRASEALHAKVQVGDVDLALLAGGVTLEDVTVRATDAPPDEAPLVGWKRFSVDLRWLPFLWKTVRFSTIELVEPHVALDRLQTGDLNLMALLPKADPNAPAQPPAEQESSWKIGIDHLGLRRGGVRFRDFFVPEAEPVVLSIDSIEVRDIAFVPEVYDKPADIRFVMKLDEGAVRTRARFTPRRDGSAVDVTLDATKLPVHRSRIYVPGVTWSDLTGFLSLALRYRLDTGGRNELTGTIGFDDLKVLTAGLDQPSLAWKALGVELEKIDLVKHHAGLKRVTLDGAVVPVRPRGPDVLPVIAAAKAAQAAAASQPTTPAPPPTEEPPAPWSWHVGTVAVTDSRIPLLAEPPLDLGVTLDASALSGPTHEGSPIKLGVTLDDGRLGVDGTLRIEPLGFAGSVTSAALDVPKLVDAVGAMRPGVLQVAKLDADLAVTLGSAAPTPGDVTIAGTTTIADLWVAGDDPNAFAVGAERVAVGIGGVTVPGALAKAPAAGRATTVSLDQVQVDKLYSRITRGEAGIVLPAFTNPPAESAASPAPAAPAAPPATAAPPTQVTIAKVQAKGRLDLMDRTVKPFYWEAFDPLTADLEQVRVPDLEVQKLAIHGTSASKGTIDVTGAYAKKSDLELVVKDLAMMPFNPFVTGLSPYSISRGSLFVTTKVKINGPKYDTTTWITLSNFDLASRSGQHVVLEQLGIPLTVAIALLRDWKGNIDLTVPVQIDEKGATVGFGTIVSGALVSALVGTLTSPLKILGAVLPSGGEGAQSLAPLPIRFRPGLSTLDAAGEEQVKQLAAFLAGRPGLGVTLAAPPTAGDLRALRESALLAQLGPRKGVIGTLRNVGARGRIVDALEARGRGEEGPLDDDDKKALDEYLADVPPPSAEVVKQLGDARVELVEKTLRERYGIPAGQIARAQQAAAEPAEGDPGVRVELGSAH